MPNIKLSPNFVKSEKQNSETDLTEIVIDDSKTDQKIVINESSRLP